MQKGQVETHGLFLQSGQVACFLPLPRQPGVPHFGIVDRYGEDCLSVGKGFGVRSRGFVALRLVSET